jgi:thiamine pyrophosphokinase
MSALRPALHTPLLTPQRAVVLLDGYYDDRYPGFYVESCGRDDTFVVCADGALRVCEDLLQGVTPDLVVGDMDSLGGIDRDAWRRRGTRFDDAWEGKTDKDYTDGQIALHAALDAGARQVDFHGGLARRVAYDHDHFLGNLSLIAEAHARLGNALDAAADDAMRIAEPLETVYLCRRRLELSRDGAGLNRVSVVPLGESARVASSVGLRWDLTGYGVHASPANALRNEFLEDASSVVIEMASGSSPVYVFHNRYERSGA